MAEKQTVKVLQVRDEEVKTLPNKKHESDAGYDLICSQNTQVSSGSRAMIPTNLAFQIPDGMFALILPRSSAFYQKGLIVHPGTIDPDYRGEVKVLVWNPTQKLIFINEGDSIAQVLFLPRLDVRFDEKKLTETKRGQGGFGSTGRVPGDSPKTELMP